LILGGVAVEGKASEFEVVPEVKVSIKIDPVEGEGCHEFLAVTHLVGDRTAENFGKAIDEVGSFLAEDLERVLRGGEMTQLRTLSFLAQSFYEKQDKDDVDIPCLKNLVLLLRPYESKLDGNFFSLQGFYREVLHQRGVDLEGVGGDFLVEARSVFYFFNGAHRSYLEASQANWILRLAKKYVIEGEEFQGYLERAEIWKRKQKKRSVSCGDDSSKTASLNKGKVAPKRKSGNKGFHSHAGKPKYGGGKKGSRPRSSSW